MPVRIDGCVPAKRADTAKIATSQNAGSADRRHRPPESELSAAARGVVVAAVSAHTGAGLDELADYLRPGQSVAMIGSSGVGKSSLVNHWPGADHQIALPIDDNDRGRHATRRRELFALPAGGLVIDTPGMRELGPLESDTGLDDAFADITALAACRFRYCHHAGEPGCASSTPGSRPASSLPPSSPACRSSPGSLPSSSAATTRRRPRRVLAEQADQQGAARAEPVRSEAAA